MGCSVASPTQYGELMYKEAEGLKGEYKWTCMPLIHFQFHPSETKSLALLKSKRVFSIQSRNSETSMGKFPHYHVQDIDQNMTAEAYLKYFSV